jgi:N utilization substance protein B
MGRTSAVSRPDPAVRPGAADDSEPLTAGTEPLRPLPGGPDPAKYELVSVTETAVAESSRHRARARAMQVLYEAEQREVPALAILGTRIVAGTTRLRHEDHVRRLVEGVEMHLDALDALIGELARGWELDRIAAVERCVLRIGLYELLAVPEVDDLVAIDEAQLLAREFSGDEAGSFVHGLLAAAAALDPRPSLD